MCEVFSPSTAALNRGMKLPVYGREGVRHLWLMDPEARTLEVFRLEGTRYVLLVTHTGLARVRAELFEALERDLSFLWGEEVGRRTPIPARVRTSRPRTREAP